MSAGSSAERALARSRRTRVREVDDRSAIELAGSLVRPHILAAGVLGHLAGCVPQLGPGELGTVRYFGEVRGEVPMRLLPPLTDRDGNIYVLYGAPDRTDTQVFVGRSAGGWSGGCAAHRGVTGLHGFVGRSLERVWYWAGTALVEVDGATGACREVLRTDPVSGTELQFLGVAPWVDETPSRRFTTAIVKGATGDPQIVLVDLDRRLPFNDTSLGEGELQVMATGAWPSARATVFVIQQAGPDDLRALFVDRLGTVVREVPVDGRLGTEPYAVPGGLQFSDEGVGVGITDRDRLLIVTADDARVVDPPFPPGGLLRWGGQIHLTGVADGAARIATLGADGSIGSTSSFLAANDAARALVGSLTVNDERSEPIRLREWAGTLSAIGTVPLVSPWPIDAYTVGSAGWLLAGPSFDSGVEPVTATAFVPVGVEVP